ncbi:MAG: histidinol-phosphate transaminase [Planctomycetota bacterium]
MSVPALRPRVLGAYAPPGADDSAALLRLASNEGPAPPAAVVRALSRAVEAVHRYPRGDELEERLGERFDLPASRVLVTAGADDALLRLSLAALGPGTNAVVAAPTFEMIPRYVRLALGELREVPWRDGEPWPREAALRVIDERTRLVFVVSPNNPTGAGARADDVRAVSQAAPQAWTVLDAAYGEYTDDDPTAEVLGLPGVLVLRTFSKAFGLAGLRVGYVLGHEGPLAALRAAGNPFPVAGPARRAAAYALKAGYVERGVRRTRAERASIGSALRALGAETTPSEANFAFARFPSAARATEVWERLRDRGVLVRRFEDDPRLADALRVTCPTGASDLKRLLRALEATR